MSDLKLNLVGQCFKINPDTKEITLCTFEDKTPNELMTMKYEYTNDGYYKVMFDETIDSSTTWKYTFLDYDQYLMSYVPQYSPTFKGVC